MGYIATNFAISTLASNLGGGDTDLELTVQTGDIAEFPVINSGGTGDDYTYLVLEDSAKNREILKVTRHDTASSTFTIVRGQEGTTRRAWLVGDSVSVRLTAQVVTDAFTRTFAAEAAADTAVAAAAAAAASYDSFDDRYLGAKGADPTVDNDGAALLEGALYWNTGTKVFRAYDGAAWGPLNAVIADGSVTTAKIVDKAVTLAKVQDIGTAKLLGRTTAGTGAIEELDESKYARTNRAQTFTTQQTPMSGTLADAATVDWDGDVNGQVVKLTLTAARTMGAPTHIIENNIYVLRLTTGGFTPSWNADYKWATVPSGLESATYTLSFIGGAGNTLIPMGAPYKTGA